MICFADHEMHQCGFSQDGALKIYYSDTTPVVSNVNTLHQRYNFLLQLFALMWNIKQCLTSIKDMM